MGRFVDAILVLFGKRPDYGAQPENPERDVLGSEMYDRFAIGIGTSAYGESTHDPRQEKPLKIFVKPVEVVGELQIKPTMISLEGIDEKIEILEIKKDLITHHYSKAEVELMIVFLNNRKKYPKYRSFFSQFDDTTDEKVQKLLKKYELTLESADLFIPDFPEDAVKIMKKYTKRVKELCNKKPKFLVIATSENFKEVDKKRDTILLVQSPFGFFYQILGAWDKEMISLSEL